MIHGSPTLQRSFSSDYANSSSLHIRQLTSALDSSGVIPSNIDDSSYLTIPSLNPAHTSSSLNVLLDSSEGLPRSSADSDWAERGAAVAVSSDSSDNRIVKRSVSDFEFGKELGVGSYSTVVLAKDIHTGISYAVKILDKRHIIKERKVKYVNIEKHALNRLNNHPGIISLFFTFQDKHHLYFVLDYASNGELLGLIRKYKTLNEDCVRYFGAQILDAISYMHDNGIVHRDIKPENILLDPNMRVKITDFGTACLLQKGDGEDADYPLDVRAKSFVGTAEYVLPELLESKYCGKPGDIWAFGCIMYQLVAGKPPFKATNDYQTFQKITHLQYAFSAGFPTVLRDLVRHILVLQPLRRLKIPDIQSHYFFESIDFSDFQQVWGNDPPSLGPYKMSAKSMQANPNLKKTPIVLPKIGGPGKPLAVARPESQPSKSSSRVAQTPKTVAALGAAHVLKTRAPSLSLSVLTLSSVLSSAPGLSHASGPIKPALRVASAPSSLSSPLNHAGPEYIPGTNILRPKVMLRNVSRPRQSLNLLAPASTPAVELALAVWSMTAEEERWKTLFGHPDERILKHGSIIACKEPAVDFERKHRGTLVELPLGYSRQTANRKATLSMLSQVASGQTGGLRERSASTLTNDENEGMVDSLESPSALVEHRVEVPTHADPLDSENSQGHGKFRKAFHMLRMGHAKESDNGHGNGHDATPPATVYSLDKPLQCVLVVTTHGRALVAAVLPSNPTPHLLLEVRLVHPQVKFREVLSGAPSRFQKPNQDQGTFAILTGKHAIAFQVDRSQVAAWTLALAKSKVNEARRVVALAACASLPPLLLPILPLPNGNGHDDQHSSPMPRTLDPIATQPPVMKHSLSEDMRSPSAPAHNDYSLNHVPTSPAKHRSSLSANHASSSSANHVPTSPLNHSPLSLPVSLAHKTFEDSSRLPRKKITVRRIAPASPTVTMPSSSAISRDDMLHAAQLAVSQSTFSPAPLEKRLSFSKDSLTPREPPRQKVTMKTSKLLARSRGH